LEQGAPYIVQKFHEPWFTNGLNLKRNFYHTLIGFQCIAHDLSSITVAPHGESKWNGVWVYLQLRFEATERL